MADPKLREMVDAFSSGAVFERSNELLDGYLSEIVSRDKNAKYLSENMLRPEVVPAMVGIILSIKQQRLVTAVEDSNKRTQFWFGFLAIASLGVGGLQVLLAAIQLCVSK